MDWVCVESVGVVGTVCVCVCEGGCVVWVIIRVVCWFRFWILVIVKEWVGPGGLVCFEDAYTCCKLGSSVSVITINGNRSALITELMRGRILVCVRPGLVRWEGVGGERLSS